MDLTTVDDERYFGKRKFEILYQSLLDIAEIKRF